MKEDFAFRGKPYNIVLVQFVKFQEHLVIIIASVESKGGFTKEGGSTLHCRSGHMPLLHDNLFRKQILFPCF